MAEPEARMHPLALQLGSLSLNAFGLLACVVLASGGLHTLHNARRRGASEERALMAFVVASLAALVAGHVGYALGNVWSGEAGGGLLGGLHGSAGLAGALGASRLVFRGETSEWRGWLDAQAPLVGLALCLGQIGCYLLGADYGTLLPPGAPPWLQALGSYPRWSSSATLMVLGPGAPAWLDQLGQRLIEPSSERSLPMHPTQLYIGGLGLLLLMAGLRVIGRHLRFLGQGFLLALLAYAALMVLFEPLRDDPRRGTLPLRASAGTWLALGLGGVAVAIVHGPLSAIGSARARRARLVLLLVLSLGWALLEARAAALSAQRPLALSCLLALALASCAASAWRRWSERGFDAHLVVTSGPQVPPGFTPGGPLQ
jgi:phosphatidylglycerol:prolipoprotein diacylglycerol transferase